MPLPLPDYMSWQIYQAYLSRPQALFHLFEDAFRRGSALPARPTLTGSKIRSMSCQRTFHPSRLRSRSYEPKSASYVGVTFNSVVGPRSAHHEGLS
jgi:hypothetical protein